MKTFKLKDLQIVENEEDGIKHHTVELADGLVINREDEFGWIIEALINHQEKPHFEKLIDKEEFMIQVKITREANDPAFFITKLLKINEISETQINVIFQGKVVDHSKTRIEDMLRMIIEEGYQGESLIRKFKEMI